MPAAHRYDAANQLSPVASPPSRYEKSDENVHVKPRPVGCYEDAKDHTDPPCGVMSEQVHARR